MSEQDKQVQQLTEALKNVSDKLKIHAEKAEKDGTLQVEMKADVDKLLTAQAELKNQLSEAQQILADLDSGGSDVVMTRGQMVAECDDYVNFSGRGQFSVDVSAAITGGGASGGALVQPDRLAMVGGPSQQLRVRDLLTFGRTNSSSVEFAKEATFTNNADVVSENPSAGKPQSDLTFSLEQEAVATVAHFIKASRQILSDAPMLQSYIDTRLTYGLKLKEEQQLLKGSGTGLNLNGLYTQAAAYANPGVTPQAETPIDRLRLAFLQVELADYLATGTIINPIDWAGIELEKDSQNNYIFSNPHGVTAPMIWGRPVVVSKSLANMEYMVGDFQSGAMGWDRELSSVTVSTENEDDFIKNMVTVLCEERLSLTVFQSAAFVKGDFDGLYGS